MGERPAHTFPFTAIVGQETLKTALILNAIDPRVGGVLIMGEKGTAKSTAVRALASLLPEISVVEGCPYGCDPSESSSGLCAECRDRLESEELPRITVRPRVVELPISATEDRVVGTLDFEAALKHAERAFHPGLLAQAHRAVLYVDEVNLLDDHLVDTLLDAASMGVNIVEREGVSVAHPARFILVGTMNPEEGEIRPQLLDRFGLCVDVTALRDPEQRVEVMRRRRAFEEHPVGFVREWHDAEEELRNRISEARVHVATVHTPDEVLYAIADLSVRAGVDGHRADTVMARAAAAYAAYSGRTETTLADIEHVAALVLAHRLRRKPLERVASDADTLRVAVAQAVERTHDAAEPVDAPSAPGEGQTSLFGAVEETSDSAGEAVSVPEMDAAVDRPRHRLEGKRVAAVTSQGRGRYVRAERPVEPVVSADIAFDATIRAAAQDSTGSGGDPVVPLEVAPRHIRTKVRSRKVGATIVFCVDASGSMGAASRIDAAKSAMLDLLKDAYQRRDRVALVVFRGERADLVLPPTASVELAAVRLRDVPTGGSTPMAAGIEVASETLVAERKRRPDAVGWIVLVTDGQANVGRAGRPGSADALEEAAKAVSAGFHLLVIDTAQRPGGGGAAKMLAENAGAQYVRLGSVDAASLGGAVRQRV